MKKPKPETAGEKIVMWDKGIPVVVVRETPGIRVVARAIDRAIARAVRNERERCGFVVYAAKCNCESFEWAREWILHPEKQKP